MIPLKDDNPTHTFPGVTVTIIIINVLVFLYEISLGKDLQTVIFQWAIIPHEFVHNLTGKTFATLISSIFLHGGIAHLGGNMLYLWIFGNNIEDRLGHVRFVFFYLFCGMLASIAQIAAAPDSRIPMLGASGAISAVLGAYLILYPRANVLVLLPILYFWRIVKLPAVWFLGFWILLQFVNSASSALFTDASGQGGVAWLAHIGGFISGIVLLKIFEKKRRRSRYKHDF